MKLLVVGSRSIKNYNIVKENLDPIKENITEIISGGARGIDELAERYARENDIPIKIFKPDWSIGARAGYLRNKKMWLYCDEGIAFWDGVSKGTQHSFGLSNELGKKITIIKKEPLTYT